MRSWPPRGLPPPATISAVCVRVSHPPLMSLPSPVSVLMRERVRISESSGTDCLQVPSHRESVFSSLTIGTLAPNHPTQIQDAENRIRSNVGSHGWFREGMPLERSDSQRSSILCADARDLPLPYSCVFACCRACQRSDYCTIRAHGVGTERRCAKCS